MIRVNEIFHSIQGESTHAGWPCVFVRLTGCNLRCRYCDTRYTYNEGLDMSIGEILGRVKDFGCRLVEITGGEPLIQQETPRLADALLGAGLRVLVETNGSRDISLLDPRCVRIVDLKCPSSGEAGANDYDNLDRLAPHDELKFVVSDRSDYEFARRIVQGIGGGGGGRVALTIHLSPVPGQLEPRVLTRWILDDRIHVRLNLQLHKFIWGPDERGV